MEYKTNLTAFVSVDTAKKIDKLCKAEGISRSKYCARIIEQHVEKLEKKTV